MKNRLLLIFLLSVIATQAQHKEITLETFYGSKNKEINNLMRFQRIETIRLKFSGKNLKGKNYTILVKEFLNGSLSKTDTIIRSKGDSYLQPINKDSFEFKFYVKTMVKNTIKMSFLFNRFSNTKKYPIKTTTDDYALHDFLGSKQSILIKENKPTYILGYFLPYLEKKTGWKMYCKVSGSKYNPEYWGKVFSIPNYFLIQILFE